MYARVAAFENADMSQIDDLVARIRERARTGTELPDAKGALMLIDRQAGRSLGITFFESEEAIRAAEPVFERMGDEIPEEKRGRRVSVDVYEVARFEGGEGAGAARVSSLEGPPERIDEGIRFADENVMPRAKELPGWKGYVFLVDRSSGRARLIALWETAQALQRTEDAADSLRQDAAAGSGQTISGVDRYEVALAERLADLGAVRT